MTPFPAPNRLHVWWARRPLVASRAAVLASLLPANADREQFLHVLGIHGDPVAARRRIDAARRRGERFEGKAYSYPRAFSYVPNQDDRNWLRAALNGSLDSFSVLDPTAGGGSIPFETTRVGAEATANDLNPVSTLIMRATMEWPSSFGDRLTPEFERLSDRFLQEREAPRPILSAGIQCRLHIHQLYLGTDDYVAVLRRSGAAIAELAAGAERVGGSAQAATRERSRAATAPAPGPTAGA